MTRDELLNSREYWITKIQLDLFAQLDKYMLENNISRTQLAEKLGVTKGYISQILNGDFDHKVSKLVDLALVMGKVPEISYPDLEEFIKVENRSESSSLPLFKVSFRADQNTKIQIA